jgi:hypothetical protein
VTSYSLAMLRARDRKVMWRETYATVDELAGGMRKLQAAHLDGALGLLDPRPAGSSPTWTGSSPTGNGWMGTGVLRTRRLMKATRIPRSSAIPRCRWGIGVERAPCSLPSAFSLPISCSASTCGASASMTARRESILSSAHAPARGRLHWREARA